MHVDAQKQVAFLLFIQRILEEGQFTSTYKFALLQSIANLCVERGGVVEAGGDYSQTDRAFGTGGGDFRAAGGAFGTGRDGALTLDSRALAEQFISIYWPQAIEFRGAGVLWQNTDRQAAIVNLIVEASRTSNGSILRFRRDAAAWNQLVRKVASNIVQMPLWKLQRLAGREENFLYTRGGNARTIVISPEIAFCFRRFYGLVIELTQSAWTNFVRTLGRNRAIIGTDSELQEFLFGAKRSSLAAYLPILREQQEGLCFYCGRRVSTDAAHVDHFIPWSRFRSDLGHNFVLADGRCNSSKLDRLAETRFLARWNERNAVAGDYLAREFGAGGIAHDIEASRRIAFFAYERAESMNAAVWAPGNLNAPLDAGWRSLFA